MLGHSSEECQREPWIIQIHDDVMKWEHFPRYLSFVREIHRRPVNSPHKGQWRGTLMFSLICAWTNGWVNNRDAGDLRRIRAHYDVTVIWIIIHIADSVVSHLAFNLLIHCLMRVNGVSLFDHCCNRFIFKWNYSVRIRNICHAWGLRKLARSCKQLRLLCPSGPWNSPGKCVLIWNKWPVNIWNDCKDQK